MAKKTFSRLSIGQGVFLIASPFINDKYFRKSVILLADHNIDGSIGFIVNQKTNLFLNQILPEISGNWPIYYGGPVGNDSLFYFHTLGSKLEGARHIVDNIWWGGSFELLKKILLKESHIKKNDIKFFAGYSGWNQGQLDTEMEEFSWLLKPATTELVMLDEPNQLWRNIIMDDPEYAIWANMPDAIYLN